MVNNLSKLIASLSLTVLIILMLPISLPLGEKFALVDLEVTATGNKNVASKASEVWIQSLAGQSVRALRLESGWEIKNGEIVSYQKQPTIFRYKGVLPLNSQMLITQHDWSGIVKLKLNGDEQILDLYSSSPKTLKFSLANTKSPILYGAIPVTEWFKLVLKIIFIFLIAYKFVGFYRSRPIHFSLVNLKPNYYFGVPVFVAGIVSLVAFFPAQMSPDSLDQWHQLITNHWNNGHPVIMTWLIWPLVQFWKTPAWIPIIQIAAISLTLGYVLNELRNWNISPKYLWICAIIFALAPFNVMMITHFWKDVLYSISILFLTGLLLKLFRTDGEVLSDDRWLIAFIFSNFYILLSRYNGVIVIFITMIGLLFFYPKYRKNLLKSGLITFALVIIFNQIFLPLAHVDPVPDHIKSIYSVHGISAYLNTTNTISDNDKKFIEGAMPLKQWRNLYDCHSVVPLYWSDSVDYDFLGREYKSLNKILLKEILNDPVPMLKHQQCVTSMLWRIIPAQNESMYTVIGGVDKGAAKLFNIDISTKESKLKEALLKYSTKSYEVLTLFWRPAFYLLILAIMVVSLKSSLSDWKFIVLFLPIFANTISLAVLMLSPDFRYQWCCLLVAIALTPILFRKVN